MEAPSAASITLSLFLCWLLWKLCWFLKSWYGHMLRESHIPTHPKNHWFWGIAHIVDNMDEFVHLGLEYVDQVSPRWFRTWVLFLFPCVFVCHPSTFQAVLTAKNVPKNHSTSGAYRMLVPWLGDGLLTSGGKKWERNRRLLTPAFHFDILKPYVNIFNHVADVLLEKVRELSKDGSSIDIYPMVSKATLHNMLKCTLSYDDDTVQNTDKPHPYVAAVQKLTALLVARFANPFICPDFVYGFTKDYKEFIATCDYVHEFASSIITARRKSIEGDPLQLKKRHLDFLDILITAEDENSNGLTDQEIRDEVDTFMFEGHDTTASAISWAVHSLAKYPDMQDKVREEVEILLGGRTHLEADDLSRLTYTTCFIKESMRMYTPVPGVTRRLDKPLAVEGVTFPVGQSIHIHPHLLHHNPAVWENHMEFRPERFLPEYIAGKDPFAFVPFSAGQRNCIGQHFAMNEIKIMLANIVSRYSISLDPERKAVPFAELVMRAKDGIYLHFKER